MIWMLDERGPQAIQLWGHRSIGVELIVNLNQVNRSTFLSWIEDVESFRSISGITHLTIWNGDVDGMMLSRFLGFPYFFRNVTLILLSKIGFGGNWKGCRKTSPLPHPIHFKVCEDVEFGQIFVNLFKSWGWEEIE